MTTEEIAKPLNLEKMVRGKLRNIFAEMIPDESLDDLVRTAWNDFVNRKKDRYGETHCSGLDVLIQTEIKKWAEEEIAPRVHQRLAEAVYQIQTCGGMDAIVDESISNLVKGASTHLLHAALSQFTQNAIEQIRMALQSNRY